MLKITFFVFTFLLVLSNLQSQNVESLKIYVGKDLTKNKSSSAKKIAQRNFQTVIWGSGVTGAADAEFSNPFVNATSYSAGDNVTSWTALTINESFGGLVPGNAFWKQSLLGYSQGAYNSTTAPVNSPSNTNGVAIFDSDFLDNGGVISTFGQGTSPAGHKGELISPRIDLTGYTDTPIMINFFSFYRDYRINELSVSLSVDDGATWIETVDYRFLTTQEIEEFVSPYFINATTDVANLTQCRIKFTFDGDYYFAIVDDVTISIASKYDLGIAAMSSSSGIYSSDEQSIEGDQIHLTGSRYFPISQLSSDLNHMGVGANIVNYGYGIVDLVDNPRLIVNVEKENAGTWQSVYTTTIASTRVVNPLSNSDELTATNVSTVLTDFSWVETGDFRVTYTAEFDGVDEDMTNNSLSHFFSLTPDNYLSKVDKDVNGNPFADDRVLPRGSACEYGSVFYFDDATSQNFTIDALNFTYYLPTNFIGLANQTVEMNIKKVTFHTNGAIAELIQEGIAVFNLNGLGTTIPLGSFHTAYSDNIIDASTGFSMGPLSDGHYFISVSFKAPSGQFFFDNNNGGYNVPFFGESRVKNYDLNRNLSTPVVLVISTDEWGETRTYNGGFGSDRTPAIGILTSSANTLSTNQLENIGQIKLYPNPTKGVLFITFNTVSELAEIKVYDVSGRLINTIKYANQDLVDQELVHIEMPKTKGVYFLQITNSNGLTENHKVVVN